MLRKLGIEAGEGRIFAWSAAVLLVLGFTDATVQNVSEALFNKRLDVSYLPLAFLASSLALVGTLVVYGRIADRSDRLKLLARTLVVLGIALLPLWLLVRADFRPVYPLLVIASGQVTSLALLAFFTALGDLVHTRQAKRLFAPMMTGVTVGTILGNRASGPLGELLGIDGLLPLCAGVLWLGAVVTLPLRSMRPRFDRGRISRAALRRPEHDDRDVSLTSLWQTSLFFRLLFITVLCSGVLGPMLYFQFQYVASSATSSGMGGAQELLAFYGSVKSWMYTGVLVVQLGAVSALYRRFGVPLAAALSPVIYLFGFLGLSVRLNLTVGVGAVAGTKLQDKAVYDPAVRVLYNLFPEHVRARASALLDGPAKRVGGAIGNIAATTATTLGSAIWVGYAAIPITGFWLATALVLWRRYPKLLLEASAERSRGAGALDDRVLLDRATVRALVPEMCSEDPAAARVAVDLVAEAEPEFAIEALAEAIGSAPAATRPLSVAALDRLLERAVTEPIESEVAAAHLERLIGERALSDRDRADVVQAYGRLLAGEAAVARLEAAREDGAPGVRLAARAALARRGVDVDEGTDDLDLALADALRGEDAAARRTAREELRSMLLCERADPRWGQRLKLLTEAFASRVDRSEIAEAFAEVAARHGEAAASAWDALSAARDDPDPPLRRSLLRFAGHAGLREQTAWLVEHLGETRPEWVSAAREGLLALGPLSSNALLRELAYGKRSKREGILGVMRELELHPEALRSLYELELDAVERDLTRLVALEDRAAFFLLRRHLRERVREEQHTALLFLAAMRREDRIAELGDRLQEVAGRRRQYAIVVEALESVLGPQDRRRLMPLLEDPDVDATAQAIALGSEIPAVEEAVGDLLEDPDELTRRIASGLAVAAGFEVVDDGAMDAVEKVKHLAALPLFEGLTVRQLMDLGAVVKENSLAAEATVVTKGEADDCLYLVVEGVVHITRGETLLAELGPGDFFGEIALFEGVARTANAVTRTRARLLGLERRDLIRLIEDRPGIAISLLETQSRRVRELTDRLMI